MSNKNTYSFFFSAKSKDLNGVSYIYVAKGKRYEVTELSLSGESNWDDAELLGTFCQSEIKFLVKCDLFSTWYTHKV